MSKPKPKLHWFKFFPSDWMSEPCLKMVSRAARSLWIDMLCLMHESKKCGFLYVGNTPLQDAARIAKALGDTEESIAPLLAELELHGVFSRNRAGVIYSRRMINDAKKRDASAKGGQIGGVVTYDKQKGIFSTQGATQGGTQGTALELEARGQRPEARNTVLRTDAIASNPRRACEEKQTASKPVANDKDWCWSFASAWLVTKTGKALQQAKSLIGRWLKETTPKDDYAALRAVIEACQENGTGDPIPWITAAIKARAKASAPFEPTDEHGWRKRFASFRQNGTWPATWGGARPGDDPRHPANILEEFGFRNAA